MSYYTRVGSSIWSWEPWLGLERDPDDITGCRARILWMALYTAPEAKRIVPGLWHGSISTMADAARMSRDHVFNALQRLLEHELVEYEQRLRVVRLTKLPDAGESPQNGKVIRSWYMRFLSVPACAVRDAHVATIRWMMEEWSRETGKPISNDHAKAWSDTFAQVPLPSSGRHGVTGLFDHDTSTSVQPSLFAPMRASGERGSKDRFTVSATVSETTLTPGSAENPKLNDSAVPVTVSDTVGSGSGSGSGSLLSDQEGGSGGGRLFVPFTVINGTGFDVDDLVNTLAEASLGKFPRALTPEARNGLSRAIDAAATLTRTPGALVCLREYVARGMEGFPRQDMTLEEKTRKGGEIAPEVVAAPGWLSRALEYAMAWKKRTEEQIALAAAARKELGFE